MKKKGRELREINDLIDETAKGNQTGQSRAVLTAEMYKLSLPLIKSVVKRYERLLAISDRDDMLHQAYLAVYDTTSTYRPDSGAKYSTLLIWNIQKYFEKICPSSDKQVEVTYPDGRVTVMGYKKFQKVKRDLQAFGAKWTVVSRYTSLDEENGDNGFHPDQSE